MTSGAGVSGGRVLYIDDDEGSLELLDRALAREGHHVRCFLDFREALRLLEQDSAAFDLAVTDFNMPRASGLEVARAIRALRPDLPVVIVSSNPPQALREQAAQDGVAAVLGKHEAPAALAEILRRLR